jgi:hypothetical protein
MKHEQKKLVKLRHRAMPQSQPTRGLKIAKQNGHKNKQLTNA